MDVLQTALALHIGAGAVGLVAALPATLAGKRRGLHTRAGRVFAICGLMVAVSALLLVIPRPSELIGLAVLAVLTGVWSGLGWWCAARKPRLPGGWLVWHLQLMGSAVIGFTTAFATTLSDGHLVAWVLPTIVGSVMIARAVARHGRSRAARTPVGT